MAARQWTEKQRKIQACNLRRRRIWMHSTGPKTAAGKAVTSQNAYKHGARSADFIRLRKLLYRQRLFIKQVLHTGNNG